MRSQDREFLFGSIDLFPHLQILAGQGILLIEISSSPHLYSVHISRNFSIYIVMAITKEKARIVTYIKKDLKEKAQQAAEQEGRSLSNYIEQLIKQDITKKEEKIS